MQSRNDRNVVRTVTGCIGHPRARIDSDKVRQNRLTKVAASKGNALRSRVHASRDITFSQNQWRTQKAALGWPASVLLAARSSFSPLRSKRKHRVEQARITQVYAASFIAGQDLNFSRAAKRCSTSTGQRNGSHHQSQPSSSKRSRANSWHPSHI